MLLMSSLLILVSAEAVELTLSTYYPALFGEYDQLRLIPRSDLPDNPACAIGSLYVKSSGVLQFCSDINGSGQWGAIPGIWTQNTNKVFLTDGLTNPGLTVGIGTTTPNLKLSLFNDAGIIAKGTFAAAPAFRLRFPEAAFFGTRARPACGRVRGCGGDKCPDH